MREHSKMLLALVGSVAACFSMYSILKYLKTDMTISFIYRCAVEDSLVSGELAEIHIRENLDPIDFYYIYPQKSQLSDNARDFLNYCLIHLPKHP